MSLFSVKKAARIVALLYHKYKRKLHYWPYQTKASIIINLNFNEPDERLTFEIYQRYMYTV